MIKIIEKFVASADSKPAKNEYSIIENEQYKPVNENAPLLNKLKFI